MGDVVFSVLGLASASHYASLLAEDAQHRRSIHLVLRDLWPNIA